MSILPCLDAGLLVGADQVDPLLLEAGRLCIVRTDRLDGRIEGRRVLLSFIGQPGADPMGLELGLALKHTPRSVGRWRRRCRA